MQIYDGEMIEPLLAGTTVVDSNMIKSVQRTAQRNLSAERSSQYEHDERRIIQGGR